MHQDWPGPSALVDLRVQTFFFYTKSLHKGLESHLTGTPKPIHDYNSSVSLNGRLKFLSGFWTVVILQSINSHLSCFLRINRFLSRRDESIGPGQSGNFQQ